MQRGKRGEEEEKEEEGGEKLSERQILVIQLMGVGVGGWGGEGGLRALCFFKDGTESQVVQLGRERVRRRRREKKGRGGETRGNRKLMGK